MDTENRDPDRDGIVLFLKETADGIGQLFCDHLRLARLELIADVKTQCRRTFVLAAAIPFAFVGYAVCCLGISEVLSNWMSLGVALLLVGGVHLAAATLVSLVAIHKLRSKGMFLESEYEANRSVNALTDGLAHGMAEAAAMSECAASDLRSVKMSGARRVEQC